MSFYDSASLVFLPSGGAGKDGKAYSIKPVPEYGNELVTNGTFDTDSDWTKGTGWTISGGTANFDDSTNSGLSQSKSFIAGKTYKILFEITQGNASIAFLSSNGVTTYVNYATYGIGIHSVKFNYSTGSGFQIFASSFLGGSFSIDNVSVKEVVVGDGDFDFSRGSNLTATRIDSNGLIEKGRENLLFQSNQFDTTWVINNASVTSGQAGYDGSNNAWLLQASGTTSYLIQNISASNGYVYTQSIYAKSGNTDFISLTFGSGISTKYAIFNLSNGTIDTDTGFIDSTIQSVGNGWYRCSISVSSSTTGSNGGLIATPSRSGASRFAAVVGDNVLIQSAQTEIGLVATEYIESGASKGKAGILEDSPRFDYSGGASCPSLLLEPSRTNLMTYSEIFQGTSSGFWRVFDNGTIEPNYGTSPEGLQNSAKIGTSGGSNDFVYNSITISSGTTYTLSCFVKNIDATESLIYGVNSSNNDLTWSGSTLTNVVGGDFESFGDGWYRIWITTTSTSTSAITRIYSDRNGGTGSIEVYGFQIEQGSYPTSYIPNHSGGSVTRNADGFQKTGASSVIGQTEGTLYIEAIFKEEGNLSQWFSLTDGTANNWVFIGKDNDDIRGYVRANNIVAFTNQTFQITNNTVVKAALSYKSGSISLYINGSLIASSTNSFSFNQPLDTIYSTTHNSQITREKVNFDKILMFKNALSNTDCEIITGTSYESFAAMATALNYTTYE